MIVTLDAAHYALLLRALRDYIDVAAAFADYLGRPEVREVLSRHDCLLPPDDVLARAEFLADQHGATVRDLCGEIEIVLGEKGLL